MFDCLNEQNSDPRLSFHTQSNYIMPDFFTFPSRLPKQHLVSRKTYTDSRGSQACISREKMISRDIDNVLCSFVWSRKERLSVTS